MIRIIAIKILLIYTMDHITNYWECFTVLSAICIILTILRKKLFDDKFSISVGFISFVSMGIFYYYSHVFYYRNKFKLINI